MREEVIENHQLSYMQEEEVGSWEYKIGENHMFWSNMFRQILRVPFDFQASLQKTIALLENPEDKTRLRTIIRAAMTTGKPWNENFKIKDFCGHVQQINTIGRPKFKDGKCTRIIGIIQRTHIKSKESADRVFKSAAYDNKDFFDNIPTGLVVIDYSNDKILKINNHLLGLFDKKASFFQNKNFKDFVEVHEYSKKEIKESLGQYFSFKNVKISVKHKSLGNLVFNVSGNLLTDKNNKEIVLVSCDDFTKRASLEYTFSESLNRAHEEIDKMVHFAHMVSHNLKAHTTNFDLLLNFLQQAKDEKERKNLSKKLFDSNKNLSTTINGLRELVAIRHMVNEQKSSLAANEMFTKVLQSNHGIIKKMNAKVYSEIGKAFHINAIPAYLESIFSNLLLNSLNFLNENECPVIRVSATQENDRAVITFEDNSMGINLAKEGDKVFAMYRKLQNMGDNSSMGLYLTKYQVELMGGYITVESDVGKGNIFQIYFPQ